MRKVLFYDIILLVHIFLNNLIITGSRLMLGEDHSEIVNTIMAWIKNCNEKLFEIWKDKKDILNKSLSYLMNETKKYEDTENMDTEEINKRHFNDKKMVRNFLISKSIIK